MRYPLLMPFMILCPAIMAPAQVSFGISLPGLSIGINQPVYPQLVQVPGYPVYYAPGSDTNYFFYDGLYWVYQDNEWYSSEWFNGPWSGIQPYDVPLFLLRVPVRYYRQPPPYFRDWDRNDAPRWGQHWGHDWEQRRGGWDHWDRNATPRPAPLPTYQRQFSGARYPQPERQQELRGQNYRYQPKEAVVREHYQQQREQAPAGRGRPEGQPQRGSRPEAPRQQPDRAPRPGNPPPAQHQQPAPPQGERPQHQPPPPRPQPAPPQTERPQHQQPAPPQAERPQHQPPAQHQQPAPAQAERPRQQNRPAPPPNAHNGQDEQGGGTRQHQPN